MSPKEQRQSVWEARVSEFKASGLKMTLWCSNNGINLEQMKYWMRKFKKFSTAAASSPAKTFVPLTTIEPTSSVAGPPLIVRVGNARIELQSGFDPQLLRKAVEALSTSC